MLNMLKMLDVAVDLYWVAGLVWLVLYLWTFSGAPCPIPVIDTMYALEALMQYWLVANAFLGTVRVIWKLRRRLKAKRQWEAVREEEKAWQRKIMKMVGMIGNVISVIVDSFWVMMLLWHAAYAWLLADLPMAPFVKRMMYAFTDIMDYWMMANYVLGTGRYLWRIWRRRNRQEGRDGCNAGDGLTQ